MNDLVLPLPHPDAALERVGGKGMSLARLARAGLPVPDGFHVTTDAYRLFVAENGIQAGIRDALIGIDAGDPAEAARASLAIGGLFAAGRMPECIEYAVAAAYAALESRAAAGARESEPGFAVRSSATAEDLPSASFAGQQETYLNVRGREAVLRAVVKCWASLWTDRAMAYRARQGIGPESVALAVVVQELVDAEAAGIMFTANPATGNRGEIVIDGAWGLGEAVVGGKVTPDTFVVDKTDGRIKERRIRSKAVMTVRSADGIREDPVPGRRRRKAAISRAAAAELARTGARIEEIFGRPMDVEWAVRNSRIFILQARPITALPEPPLKWVPPRPGTILARVSFTEFIPDALSPLFATLGLPVASAGITRMQTEALGIRGNPAYFFEVVNGYAFSTMVLKESMKVALRVASITRKIFQYGEARCGEAPREIRALRDTWSIKDAAAMPAAELLSGARELFAATADYFQMAQSWPIPRASMSEGAFTRFYDRSVKRKNDPAAAVFLRGLDSLPLRAEKSLYDLAAWIKERPVLAGYLERASGEQVRAALREDPVPAPLSGEFAAGIAAHLSAYGHIVYDLDFAKAPPAEDPAPLIETMKAYLSGKAVNPYARQRSHAEERAKAEQAVIRRLGPRRRKRFTALLSAARERAPQRENAIADLGIPYPGIRRLLGELGRRLAASGAMDRREDVYWLEAREADGLASCLDRGEPLSNLSSILNIRRRDWERARKAAPPNIVLPEKWKLLAGLLARRKTAGNILQGLGVSAGTATAPARVLRGPEDFGSMRPGDVLVAVTTTPAWTPLFAMASAVVTDIGGPLSHSSIVAREYGIPAVMAAKDATRRITSGGTVTVDGTNGTVRIQETD